MPIFSLPNKYGIGTFGKEAYNFVDFLKEAGQSYWQILPLSPTSYGDSPYQSFSAFAGNPYFIDLDDLAADGYLKAADYQHLYNESANKIDYSALYNTRFSVLKKAYANFDINNNDYQHFAQENSFWLDDYALFMAIKEANGGKSWNAWQDEYKYKNKAALKHAQIKYADDVNFHKVVQFWFFKQWTKLKSYANDNGIKIIGDIPIYVALDSVDVWASPENFLMDASLNPTKVAGCPPDFFSQKGQLWGNPIYDWEYMKNQSEPYSWWCSRIKYTLQLYDIVRIDHFRGFESYYAVDYGRSDAIIGEWCKGPGYEFFKILKDKFPILPIIAEDLGFITDEVRNLLKITGFPGMKVLQFGFDANAENEHLPHNCHKNSVVYTGTHDNDTIVGWINKLCEKDLSFAKNYFHTYNKEDLSKAMIYAAFATNSDTVIIPMQDYMMLDSKGRINTPSTIGGNWTWRLESNEFCKNLAIEIDDLTKLYGR